MYDILSDVRRYVIYEDPLAHRSYLVPTRDINLV